MRATFEKNIDEFMRISVIIFVNTIRMQRDYYGGLISKEYCFEWQILVYLGWYFLILIAELAYFFNDEALWESRINFFAKTADFFPSLYVALIVEIDFNDKIMLLSTELGGNRNFNYYSKFYLEELIVIDYTFYQ